MNAVIHSNELVAHLKPSLVLNQQLLAATTIDGFSLDTRTLKKGECFIALKGKNYDGNAYVDEAAQKGAALIITSRPHVSVPVPVVVVEDTLAALGAVAHFIRIKNNVNVVGITGSVGKTTTKEMLYHIVREKRSVVKTDANENNVIGVSKTLMRVANSTDICITEMGSNKYGEIAELATIAAPDVGVITDVGPAHLEGFYRLERVVEEKRSILRSARTIGVVNFDNPFLKDVKYPNTVLRFGTQRTCDVYAHYLHSTQNDSYFLVNDKYPLRLKTPAYFNMHNALAAIGSSMLFGFSLKEATKSLCDFEFPPMRMEIVQRSGYAFLNDTYNANPLSFKSGLDVVRNMQYSAKVGVFGDMLELGENASRYHSEVIQAATQAGFKYLFLVGDHMHAVGKELARDNAWAGRIYFFGSAQHKEIADALRLVAKEGSLVYIKGSHAFYLGKILEYFL